MNKEKCEVCCKLCPNSLLIPVFLLLVYSILCTILHKNKQVNRSLGIYMPQPALQNYLQ